MLTGGNSKTSDHNKICSINSRKIKPQCWPTTGVACINKPFRNINTERWQKAEEEERRVAGQCQSDEQAARTTTLQLYT